MDTLFNQQDADREIIGSLINTNGVLWRELERTRDMLELLQQSNRRNEVKILQDLTGAYYLAKEYVLLAEEDAVKIAEHAKHDLAMIEKFLQEEAAEVNGQTDTSVAGQPAAPADTAQPADQSQDSAPADPNAQASDQSQTVAAPAAPADPNQPPADPNAQPAPVNQPALDANGNPVQPAPAQDPNLAQPQPEQPVMPPLQ